MQDPLIILTGDCRETLRTLADESVDCCVTSPPYWNLRDYGCAGQIGLEDSVEEWVAQLVAVFEEVRRVLKPDGTCWVNLGDSYVGARGDAQGQSGLLSDRSAAKANCRVRNADTRVKGLKPKDLVGQPWRVAFALQAAGWWLRQDIIWSKPNPMPESVGDRCTKAHEYIFHLTKSERYYFDAEAISEPATCTDRESVKRGGFNGKTQAMPGRDAFRAVTERRNRRDVWTLPTQPYAEAHFATFPPSLPRLCILAGCRPGGVVLDPFGGSGTTGAVALEEGRRAILCELNPEYVRLIHKRTANITLPLNFHAPSPTHVD